jgi:hypothetical protein
MTDIVKMLDPGTQVVEAFVYGVGRIDHMGGVSRIVFFAPTKLEQECVNEMVLKLIVPTDQLAKIAAALVQPRGPSITEHSAINATNPTPKTLQ